MKRAYYITNVLKALYNNIVRKYIKNKGIQNNWLSGTTITERSCGQFTNNTMAIQGYYFTRHTIVNILQYKVAIA